MFELLNDTILDDNGAYIASIEAYISDDIEQLINFCEKNDYFEGDNNFSLSDYKGSCFGVISSLNVAKEHRGNGYGDELLDHTIYKMENNSVDYVFLIADGIQKNNFDIIKWYNEVFGFEIIANLSNCPLMVLTF
ncbi:MAG: GNAT family N-acetyltransferase [Clostridium sp.]|nr:GNAT family N-acetyltransferase [Clostridium sp.]